MGTTFNVTLLIITMCIKFCLCELHIYLFLLVNYVVIYCRVSLEWQFCTFFTFLGLLPIEINSYFQTYYFMALHTNIMHIISLYVFLFIIHFQLCDGVNFSSYYEPYMVCICTKLSKIFNLAFKVQPSFMYFTSRTSFVPLTSQDHLLFTVKLLYR